MPPIRPPDLVVVTGIEGAPLRYRGHALAQAHRSLGGKATILHHLHRDIPGAISPGGMVVFYRVPWSSWVRSCVEAARSRQAAVIFSVDDLIFSPELRDRIPAMRALPATEAEQWMEGVRRYQATAHACRALIASTPAIALAAEAQGLSALVLENRLSREVALLSQAALWDSREDRERRRAQKLCRIGYLSGTTTHDADWALVEPAVSKLLSADPSIELWLLGPVRGGAGLEQHPRVRRLGSRPYQELPRLQAELDIVVAPLESGLEFSEAKSAIKWVEAAAVGVPAVVSPTEPFRAAISDGVTGMLADGNGWLEKLSWLIDDVDLRDRVGRAARAEVYRNHGPARAAGEWALAWPRLLELGKSEHPLPDGDPEDQPSVPVLEPEAPDGYLDTATAGVVKTGARLGGTTTVTTILRPTYPRLWRVDIETTTFGAAPQAPLELRLSSGEQTLATGRIDPTAIADDGWTSWTFDAVDCPGRRLDLSIAQPGARRGRGSATWLDGSGQPNVRSWVRPDRQVICAVAMGRSPKAIDSRSARPSRAMVLWHKGRHSLAAQGLGPTYRRVEKYLGRWWRGRQGARGRKD